jgi:hypothetical protein
VSEDGRDLVIVSSSSLVASSSEDTVPADGADVACVRSSEAEAPTAVALGDDLDGDGVREVWAQLADALVAWDDATIVEGVRVERARIAHAGGSTEDVVSTDEDGVVWAGTTDAGWQATETGWRFAAADGLAAAVDDAGLAEPDRIALVPDGTYSAGGFGPDVLAAGAPSLWTTVARDDERPVFEMLFARE